MALRACDDYNREQLSATLRLMADDLGLSKDAFRGKKVVVKPNLVAPMKPDEAATTHPVFLAAVLDLLHEYEAEDISIAESPGGLYSEAVLKHAYKVTGIDIAESCGARLNYDTSAAIVNYKDGKVCHAFNIITPIREADVLVDLCKLKSHSLTEMSCAVKNFFGVIPGIEKFEMHSAFPEIDAFSEMIVDLCSLLTETHEVLAICDGIVAMEGNGPTGGKPKKVGTVLMSGSPFCLDTVAARIIGCEGRVSILKASAARGKCPESADAVDIRGTAVDELIAKDFRKPDTDSGFLNKLPNFLGGRFAKAFSPKPAIDPKKCVGCGVCARSCPQHTITIQEIKGKKRAVIDTSKCIRCFCCQELCPFHVVKIRKNPITALLS